MHALASILSFAVCTRESCPKMIATKDEFLCAAHPQPRECCAIDYIVHQINGFAALLNSDFFPNRYGALTWKATRGSFAIFAFSNLEIQYYFLAISVPCATEW